MWHTYPLFKNQSNMEKPLNNAVPESSLIRRLAKEKRDLELENLDLRTEIAILREDIAELKAHSCQASSKDINKMVNNLGNLWGQIGKKVENMATLCQKTEELKTEIHEFVKELEKYYGSENKDNGEGE